MVTWFYIELMQAHEVSSHMLFNETQQMQVNV